MNKLGYMCYIISIVFLINGGIFYVMIEDLQLYVKVIIELFFIFASLTFGLLGRLLFQNQ